MRLLIPESGEHTISVNQTDSRCFIRDSGYKYSFCRAIVAKIDFYSEKVEDLWVKYISAESGEKRDLDIHFENLEEGEYFIFVEFDWKASSPDTNFCLSCYGASRSCFVRDENSLFEKADILKRLFASKSDQRLPPVKAYNFLDYGDA